MRALPLLLCAAFVLAIAPTVSANHGYQGYTFHNATDRNQFGFILVFDRPISHLGDQLVSWPRATCTFESKARVSCKGGDHPTCTLTKATRVVCAGMIHKGESVKVFVSTPPSGSPPSYVSAKLSSWAWAPGGAPHSSCRLPMCSYLGITSPTPANVPGPPG